jgi:hypothetical protein
MDDKIVKFIKSIIKVIVSIINHFKRRYERYLFTLLGIAIGMIALSEYFFWKGFIAWSK